MTSLVRFGVNLACAAMVFAFAGGCGDDGGGVGNGGGLVGGACRDDRDCAERCLRGGDFPGGTCSVWCGSDRDCPPGTYCIDKEGGVCLLDCRDSRDCRGGYECSSEGRRGGPGSVPVCIDD